MTRLIKENKNNNEQLFYICYCLLLISFFMSEAFNKQSFVLLDVTLYIILVIKIIFFQKYTLKQVINIYSIGFCVIISGLLSKNTLIIRSFLLIIASKNIDLNKLINIDFKTRGACLLFIIILSKSGIIDNLVSYRDGIIRYSMGFEHPNLLAINIMVLYLTYLYLYNKKRIIGFSVFLITLIFINNITGNRSCIIVIVIAYLLSNFKFIFNNNYFINIFASLPFIFGSVSIIFGIIDSNKYYILSYINKLLNTRVYNCYKFIQRYGISIFGQKIDIIGTKMAKQLNVTPQILDNAYMYILISFGVIVFIISIIGYIILIKKIIMMKEYDILIIIVSFLIIGLMETYFFYPLINFTIIFFTKIIFSNAELIRYKNKYFN